VRRGAGDVKRTRPSAPVRALVAALVVLVGVAGFIAFARFAATVPAIDFPPPSAHVVDPANEMDTGYSWGTLQQLERLQERTGMRVMVAIVALPRGSSIEDYGDGLFRAWGLDAKPDGRTALLLIDPATNAAAIKVGAGLASVLDDDVIGLIMEKRIAPHLAVNGITAAASRGADTIVDVLQRGPAALQASAPEQGSWFEANRDRMFLRFLGGLIAFLALAMAINLATLAGWLPQQRQGLWRVLDWITGLAGAIKVSSSDSSSSRSSGRSGGYSGGGGTSGGGGASGTW
jgi:uncharacterized protein